MKTLLSLLLILFSLLPTPLLAHELESFTVSEASPNPIPIFFFLDHDATTAYGILGITPLTDNLFAWAYAPITDEPSLLTESQTNPTSVTTATPRFSAIYNDPDAGDTSGKYRIQISTSSAFATTLWDSGTTTMATTTEGTRSPDISYAGSTSLASSTTYYWRIKFWDASTTESVWSTATSTFVLANIQYVQTFTYNKIGNIATSSSQGEYLYTGTGHANPHAPTSIGGVSLTYDNNGNVLTYGSKAYTWDYRNRMTQAGTGVSTSTYAYDYAGNRVSEVLGGITTKYASRFYSTNGATTTKYIYAGDTLIATVEKIGNATTTHIVHPDHLGGTNIITDASGNVVETLDYYPFGSIRTDTRTGSFDERKKYIGEQYDTATSLSYLNARYYDGVRGQFLSEDPTARDNPDQFLGDPQQLNSYSYARNNPIAFKDPSGKFAIALPLLYFAAPTIASIAGYVAIGTALILGGAYLSSYTDKLIGTVQPTQYYSAPHGSNDPNDFKDLKGKATLSDKIKYGIAGLGLIGAGAYLEYKDRIDSNNPSGTDQNSNQSPNTTSPISNPQTSSGYNYLTPAQPTQLTNSKVQNDIVEQNGIKYIRLPGGGVKFADPTRTK